MNSKPTLISKKILYLLNEKGISANKLQNDLKLSNNAVTYWKSGRSSPSQKTLEKIADYFNLPLSYFYDTKTPSPKDEGVDEDVLDVLNKLDQAGITAEKLSQLTDEQFIKLGAYLEGLLDSVQNK